MPGSWQPPQPPQPCSPCCPMGIFSPALRGPVGEGGVPSHCCHSLSVHTQMMERCGKASIKAICLMERGAAEPAVDAEHTGLSAFPMGSGSPQC